MSGTLSESLAALFLEYEARFVVTRDELLVAALAAERWPKGLNPDFWGTGPLATESGNETLAILSVEPTLVSCGCPALAVAAARGELTCDGLSRAYVGLKRYFADRDRYFAYLLQHNPPEAARLLRLWADEAATPSAEKGNPVEPA